MKNMKYVVHRAGAFLCLALILLSVTGCLKQRKPRPQIDPGFADFISSFTTGTVSSESVIRIRLASEFNGALTGGSATREDMFRFSPNIEGKAYWIDKRTIEFRPEKALISGTTYNGKFLLSKIMEVPKKYRTFPFQFEVITQNFSLVNEGLWVPDERNPSVYQLKGLVKTADVAENKDLETMVEARHARNSLKLSWSHDPDRRTHHFIVDSIVRGSENSQIELSWSGKKIGVSRKGSEKVEVPAVGVFKVTQIRVIQEPEQYISLTFSDPLQPDQLLDGLIRLGTRQDLRFTIDKNQLKVFFPERMEGKATLFVDAAVKNISRNPLVLAFSSEVSFEDVKPALRLLGKGVILPGSEGLILPFEAVNLGKVDVKIIKIFENNIGQFLQVNSLEGSYEMRRVARQIHQETINLQDGRVMDFGKWNTFSVDLSKIIDQDPGAIYNVSLSFKKEYSLFNCNGTGLPENSMKAIDREAAEEDEGEYYESYDDYYGFYPDGYLWQERDNPCHISYYNSERFVRRNILASDLGILAKAGDQNSMVFAVTDLRSTDPVSNAALELFDYQNQMIGKGSTDGEGMLKLELKEKPWLLIARKGKQRGYLKLDDGSSLSLSKFDVGGAVVQKGIKGYLFGERGVWRPGDTLFLTFILEDKNKTIPGGHPVTLELTNPRGQLYNRQVNTNTLNGFYRFTIPTQESVPTGNWTAEVKVGGASFAKTIKIETIKPNRLKLKLDFPGKIISAQREHEMAGKLSSSWLTGAVAGNMKAVVSVTLGKEKTSFAGYSGYEFDNPAKSFSTEELVLFEGTTDASGNASVPVSISTTRQAPGMLRANFHIRVFEESGDFSSDYFTMPYSPYSEYVGIQVPKGEKYSGMLRNDQQHRIDVATVDENGRAVSRNDLQVKVIRINWRWWWNASGHDLASYEGNFEQNIAYQTTVNTLNGRGYFLLKVDESDWGRFLILVEDPQSGHVTGKVVYVDYPYWSRERRPDPEAATMLSFSTDKPAYTVGETAVVTIPTGGQGRALISVENGSRVLDAFWVKTTDKETRVNLKMTAEMTPNVFIHVSLIQPHAQAVNDLPVRLYGVVPVQVTNPATILKPKLDLPAALKPEQTVSVKVSEEKGMPMTYVLAIVDEGLLDLTRFKTPDPWNVFYAREALGVKTWDIFDLVLGAYGGKLEQAFAIGGDADKIAGNPKKASRFKPMVIYLGPFSLKGGATATHNIKIPQYIGSVRAMLIAGQNGGYGMTEKTVPVKKPLMVLATLPRVAGPGESLRLPITVFAMEKHVRDVKVSISFNEMFTAVAGLTKNVRFSQTGDQVVTFDLKSAKRLGVGKVKIVAECGNERAETSVELDVRNANSPVTITHDKAVEAGKNWKLDYAYPGMAGTNKAILEVSALIPVDFERRLQWLIAYPYGCAEQTTSSAFPQLFVNDVADMNESSLARIQGNIKAAIQRLRSFQLSNGGFSYWPGSSGVDDWTSVYVGHFLLEAEAKGFSIPPGMKDSWVRYTVNAAKAWAPRQQEPVNYYSWWYFTQAYRLAVLAQSGNAQLPAMNQLRERSGLSPEVRIRLAMAYHYAGQKDVAASLIRNVLIGKKELPGMEEIYGSVQRDMAMALEALTLIGDKSRAFLVVKDIIGEMNSDRWMSTQSSAFSLMAVSRYLKMAGGNAKGFSYTYKTGNTAPVTIKCTKSISRVELPAIPGNSSTLSFTNNAQSTIYARVVLTGTPETGEDRAFAKNLDLAVVYKDMKGKVIDVGRIKQGTDFYAEVTVTHPGIRAAYRNLALRQVFPSGWEIINLRMSGSASSVQGDVPAYEDIRDDRVLSFFDIPRAGVKRFVVLLNATYLGRFYLAGPYCEAMYDNEIAASRQGRWIEVVQ